MNLAPSLILVALVANEPYHFHLRPPAVDECAHEVASSYVVRIRAAAGGSFEGQVLETLTGKPRRVIPLPPPSPRLPAGELLFGHRAVFYPVVDHRAVAYLDKAGRPICTPEQEQPFTRPALDRKVYPWVPAGMTEAELGRAQDVPQYFDRYARHTRTRLSLRSEPTAEAFLRALRSEDFVVRWAALRVLFMSVQPKPTDPPEAWDALGDQIAQNLGKDGPNLTWQAWATHLQVLKEAVRATARLNPAGNTPARSPAAATATKRPGPDWRRAAAGFATSAIDSSRTDTTACSILVRTGHSDVCTEVRGDRPIVHREALLRLRAELGLPAEPATPMQTAPEPAFRPRPAPPWPRSH